MALITDFMMSIFEVLKSPVTNVLILMKIFLWQCFAGRQNRHQTREKIRKGRESRMVQRR